MYLCSKFEDSVPFGNVGTELHASGITYQLKAEL